MKARAKAFTISSRDANTEHPIETRLIRAQTQAQVRKFREAEVLKALWEREKIEVAGMEEYGELRAAKIEVEEIPEAE
jgi:hypothetical protein